MSQHVSIHLNRPKKLMKTKSPSGHHEPLNFSTALCPCGTHVLWSPVRFACISTSVVSSTALIFPHAIFLGLLSGLLFQKDIPLTQSYNLALNLAVCFCQLTLCVLSLDSSWFLFGSLGSNLSWRWLDHNPPSSSIEMLFLQGATSVICS